MLPERPQCGERLPQQEMSDKTKILDLNEIISKTLFSDEGHLAKRAPSVLRPCSRFALSSGELEALVISLQSL